MDDILIFTPVRERQANAYRLEAETLAALCALEWNGATTNLFQRDNPYADGHKNILHQYQRGRATFLAGRWDAMLVIESDVIPPADTLRKLAALKADLAYGHYVFRGSPTQCNIFERYPGQAKNHGEALSVWPDKYLRAMREVTVQCSGGGLGCVLIKRHVLEQIDFRRPDEKSADCDTYFTMDVYAAGFTMWADLSVRCGHKTAEGAILWPPSLERLQENSK